jgi:hypothetical protein
LRNAQDIAVAVAGLTVAAASIASCASGPTIDGHTPLATCVSRHLEPAVDSLIRPVLLGYIDMRRSSNPSSGEATRKFEDPFHALLESRDPRVLEAEVALTAYYLGEHAGEELIESLLSKVTPKTDALVATYRVCRPRTSFEQELTGVVVLRTKYDIYDKERRHSRKDG